MKTLDTLLDTPWNDIVPYLNAFGFAFTVIGGLMLVGAIFVIAHGIITGYRAPTKHDRLYNVRGSTKTRR